MKELIKEQAIMVVSFGTSYNESREATIGAIERAIANAFPVFAQYRAFTSQRIIHKLRARDGVEIDGVEKALERAEADGIRRLVVQPTHLMDGFEYRDVRDIVEAYRNRFEAIVLAKPLLADEEDYRAVARAAMDITSSFYDGETAICFMGHGTEADANQVYFRLQEELRQEEVRRVYGEAEMNVNPIVCPYFIGTVEAKPTLMDVMAAMEKNAVYRRVVLEPLMVVAGDHANHDMAGDDEDSWKCVLEAKGYQVECVLKGLGEFPAIHEIYVAHVQEAVKRLKAE